MTLAPWDPGLIILALALVAGLFACRAERRAWNGGKCADCARPWMWFDNDSQGGRGYRCDGCAPVRRIWVSWPGIDSLDNREACMAELTRMEEALRAYVLAQSRMLEGWAEGDEAVRTALWQNLHACENEGREALREAGICVATGRRIEE